MLLAGAVVAAWHYYLWRRLVRDITKSVRARRTGAIAFAALGALFPFALIRPPPLSPRPFFFAIYTWSGVAFLLLAALGATEIVRALVLVVARARKREI